VILLFQFGAVCALAQVTPEGITPKASEPEAVVRSLYREIVARHPVGVPHGEDREQIYPYLSKNLIRRFDVNQACVRDYLRQNYEPHSKPPFDWIDLGLFSGMNEEALPVSFHLDRTQPLKDGAFRVYLRLNYGQPSSLIWHVVAVVVPENGRFVVDDVILQKDATGDGVLSVSQILTHGCDGSRWVGYGTKKDDAQ